MPAIIETTPTNLQDSVVLNVYFKVKFNVDLDASSIDQFRVILAVSDTEEIIPGVPGYVYGTKTVTFKLFDYLTANTEYTFILVGGDTGILTKAGAPALNETHVIRFKTGTEIDPAIPLAKRGPFDGTQPFTGEDGIYQQVYERTGEPISHIVTTAAAVGPSGDIIPADAPDIYLPPEDLTPLEVFVTVPADDVNDVTSGIITIDFSRDVTQVVDADIVVKAAHFAELLSVDDPEYTYEVSDSRLTITLTNFTLSASYVVTLKSTIEADSVTLGADYSFTFDTEIIPFYTTIGSIRSALGSLIIKISDDDIKYFIYKHSFEIQQEYSITVDPLPSAAIKYVVCATQLDLIKRRIFEGGPVTTKRLADLEVTHGMAYAKAIVQHVEDLEDCINKNNNILSGGTGFNVVSAVRGKNDPRRPIKTTSWTRLTNNSFGEETSRTNL